MRIGIIGATGWLGSALGGRLLSSRVAGPQDLVLLNRSGPPPEYHGRKDLVWATSPQDLAARSDVIVVSVRPGDWPGLRLRAEGRLVLSFMAGVGIGALSGCGGRVVRTMPNAAADNGASYSLWFAAPGVTEADRAAVTRILSSIGTSDELTDEDQIDLMTALPGSGAAYPALMAGAMLDFMRAHGVPEPIARRAAEATILGGAGLLAGRIEQASELVAAYLGYRGTTAAGLEAAERAGFSRAVTQALEAAADAARRMTTKQSA